MAEDDERVRRAAKGDRRELDALLRDALPGLRANLRIDPRWNRSFDVEDVLQVTCLEAFLRIRGLQRRSRDGFAAWLRRISENNLVDAVRELERGKRPDARRRITRGAAGESARTLLGVLAEEGVTASSRLALEEQIARLHAALRKLPASYRTVLEQVDLAERTVPEVAEELDRSAGAVHMLRARAKDRLRELLRDDPEFLQDPDSA